LAFAAATTFAPKNLRISASLSRCWTEMASKEKKRPDDAASEDMLEGPAVELGRKSGYFTESSANARSRSCDSSFFSFALCFLSAFLSILEDPGIDVCSLVGGAEASESLFFFFLDYHMEKVVND
jgi:hypothetical protein